MKTLLFRYMYFNYASFADNLNTYNVGIELSNFSLLFLEINCI